jgi:hypothetical protein
MPSLSLLEGSLHPPPSPVCMHCWQLCFDFIQSSADGRLYCIECNPRTSSVITEFHNNPQLATGVQLLWKARGRWLVTF